MPLLIWYLLLPLLWPSWSTQQVDADRRPKTGRTADGGRPDQKRAEGKKKGREGSLARMAGREAPKFKIACASQLAKWDLQNLDRY